MINQAGEENTGPNSLDFLKKNGLQFRSDVEQLEEHTNRFVFYKGYFALV